MTSPSLNSPDLTGSGLAGIVPEVRAFHAGRGAQFRPGPLVRIAADQGVEAEASLLLDELAAMLPARVEMAGAADADIQLRLGPLDSLSSEEGYQLHVDGTVTITAPTAAGIFYGTRTLLQSLTNSGGAQAGTVVDEPAVAVRSLHVDAARKYFSPAWFQDQIRHMSWFKLNELQLHFSENEGFRLESSSHPEIVSAEHLTKQEVADIIHLATRYHVDVVPALDVPGHLAQALESHPQWRASDTAEGRSILDYSVPAARQLVLDLIDEYADLFPSTAWHLGGDEVFQLDTEPIEGRFPRLGGYATGHVGPTASGMDGYVHYLTTVAAHLGERGKTRIRAWNDALYAPGISLDLPAAIDVAYWARWHPSMPTVETIRAKGHRLLNLNDEYFYYVLTSAGRSYFDKPRAESIYRDWSPGVFPAGQQIADEDPAIIGAGFAIWCDEPARESEEEVADGIALPLRAMASKAWNPHPTCGFTTWRELAAAVGSPWNGPPPIQPTPLIKLGLRPTPSHKLPDVPPLQ